MTSTAQPAPNSVNVPSASSPTVAQGSQRPPSYANATKGKQLSPPANAQSASPLVVGGLASSQHAPHSNTASPVNGRPSVPPAVPTAGPAIVNSASIANGTPSLNDHVRKPSVTISAQGTSGYLNGSATGPAVRPPINFGSINNAVPSPNMANSTPHMHHNSLSAPYPAPARSPSPIPQPPTASGGRPPSTLSGQGSVSFGQLPGGADGPDQTLRSTGPGHQLQQAQHLRRESSQSAHSDMSANINRNFVPGNRAPSGRGQYNQQYQGGPQIPYSPSNTFRPGLAMERRTASNVSQYQPQGPGQMRGPNSPFPQNRSPAMQPAAMQQQPHMHQNPPMPHPYGGYPQQHLNPQQNPGMYMPQDFNTQQYGYYQQPFMQQPHLQGYGAPPSPQPFQQHRPPQYSMANPYAQPPPDMSRSISGNGINRPPSTLAQPSTPSQAPRSPGPGSNSPAPSQSSYRAEPRKSKAIVIKRPDGAVVDIKKEAATIASPSPVQANQPRGPVVVTTGGVPSSSTPPPRANAPTPQHVRTESQQAKSAEEKKAEFAEAIKRNLEADKADEVKKEAEKSQKALKEKEIAERKVQEEEAASKAKEDAAKAKEAADSKAASAESAEQEAARKKKEEDEEFERQIAEMEAEIAAKEKEEEERQKAYEEKKKQAAAEKAKQEAAAAANEEEELKRQEREAEEREEAKLKGKTDSDADAEGAALFAKLKKNTQFGPSATEPGSGVSTPRSESPAPQAVQPVQPVAAKSTPLGGKGGRPTALKLETNKPIEPAQPTAGMQSLKTSRFLQVKSETVKYPEGIQSPNPAINQSARSQGRRYDKNFLLQFQQVFKEKPSIDWDKVIKDTVGDSSDSARPGSARTPSMGGRSMSNRPPSGAIGLGAMGNFTGSTGPRTLPPGTSSEQRFQASNLGGAPRAGSAIPPFGQFQPGRGSPFPTGAAPGMARTPSSQSMSGQGMNSPRNASQRGRGSRRGGNPAQENELRKKMPLTANLDIAPLEVSNSGWKPASIVAPQSSQPLPGGHLPPDMVQRKVKAALNKMTPEKFDKIANDILQISSQSKDESDGRTLRQVIQLTFEKACDEAHWASMYAKFCKRMLEEMGPEIRDEGVRDKAGQVVVGGALFRKYLLNRCQEEFERGWEVNLPEKPEGQTEEAAMLSDEYYIAAAAKRRGLGLIQFIGELYKLGMLTLRIMHECVVKLLQFQGIPDETAVESLVKLLKTIGMTMDNDSKGHAMIDTYMDRIAGVRDQEGLPSRVYYMLLDISDLRKKKWQSKENEKGPKTIQEIHVEAQMAQQAADAARQNTPRGGPNRPQMGRGDARSASYGMPPPDYPRNQVGMDDLKKLTRNARNTSSGPGALGPSSLLGSRSSSGRRGLGPTPRGDDSGASSRTGTPPVKEKQSTAHVNAYDALAALDASGDTADDVASPPSTSSSPQATKAQPAKTPESEAAQAT